MKIEQPDWVRRSTVHSALADVTRLRVVDLLATSDASSSELGAALDVPTNLLAHHVNVLEAAGLLVRRRSEGDGRRSYLQLVPAAFDTVTPPGVASARRMLFVCTANSARSHLAAALWARASAIPSASAGTPPAGAVDPGAGDAAARHELALRPGAAPRLLADFTRPGDLVGTVCDRAHDELGGRAAPPGPGRPGPPRGAARWLRAELAVQTKSIRRADATPGGVT
ncbi:MAG: helix-turn-helix domain-containing protein, partial [Nocardioides sp.]|nr:helix-turn-helix domain-containing protein [Nocardioides sp.]